MKENIKASVCMITYGHEKYIEEAILSILDQVVNFDFDLIISNDKSPDATDTKIKELIKVHPKGERIKYFKQETNLGITSNFVFALKQCEGEYIAICEGDDFWIDINKLQDDINFLDKNQDYSAVGSNSKVIYQHVQEKNNHLFSKFNKDSEFRSNDLIQSRKFHTATFTFRSKYFKNDFPLSVLSADRVLFLLISCFGKIKYFKKVTAVYRKNNGGISLNVTSKQLKKDLIIPSYLKNYSNEINLKKLKLFIINTIFNYSKKIYLFDFIEFSLSLLYFNFLNRDLKFKLSGLKQDVKFILKNMNKIRY